MTETLKDNRRFKCPKHGVTTRDITSDKLYIGNSIDRTPHISVSLPEINGGQAHYHCLLCYSEWLSANIPRLEEA